MDISVCIIVKNDPVNLERCLKSLEGTGFEINIIDTGSIDETKKVALKYSDRVFEYKWNDDFSQARNYSIKKSTHDWILVLDSDEFIQEIHLEDMKRLILENESGVGRIKRKNLFDGEKSPIYEWINRIFNKKVYKYSGRVHEQVVSIKDQKEKYLTYKAPVTIGHTGYAGSIEDKEKKAQRNIKLLKKELEVNNDDPYILYQIGKSYYMINDYKSALINFEKVLRIDIDTDLEYVNDLIITYGYAMINSGRAKEALNLEGVYEIFKKTADFVFLMGLIYMNNNEFDKAVNEFLKAVTYSDENRYSEGVNSYLAYYNAGVIKECLGESEEAAVFYKNAAGYEKADERYNFVIKNK